MAFPKLLQKLFQNSGAGSLLREDIIPLDSALSTTSTNAVQNKVVKSAVDTKVTKTGDTMSGTLTVAQGKNSIDGANATGLIQINANGNSGGGQIRLHGKSHTTNAGEVIIYVNNGTDSEKSLVIKPNGTMTWCGNEVVPVANNAAAHNGIYRGIDLTTKYTEAQISAKIQAGDFSDLFIGDYIPKTLTIDGTSVTANWVIAHFNYYMKMGWTADGLSSGFAVSVPHVVLVPDRNLISAQMNTTNTTSGGYLGSAMHTTTIPKITTALQNGFGSSHIISFASYLSSTVNTSLASMAGCGWTGATTAWGCTWTKVECRLMSEQMVYGSAIMSSSGFDAGEAKQQLALFALNPLATNIRANWWLSSVASSTSFAYVDGIGGAYAAAASSSLGVRPFFLYH